MDVIHYTQKDIYGLLSIVCFIFYYTLHGIDGFFMKIFLLLAFIMGTISIINLKIMNAKKMLFMIVFAIIILVHLVVSTDIRMLVAYLVIISGMYVNTDDLITWMFWIKLFSYLIALLLGLYWGNVCALHGGILLLLYLCKNRKIIGIKHYLIVMIATLVLYIYTGTGALIVGMGVTLLLSAYWIFLNKTKIFHWKIIEYIFPVALFANLICVLGLVEKKIPFIGQWASQWLNVLFLRIVDIIDVVTSRRISLAASSWPIFGVSLLGGNVDYSLLNLWEGVYFYLDSGMMWLLQEWGIIITIVFMWLSIQLMKYLIKNNEYILIISGIAIALWAINEDMLLTVDTNFLIALMGKVVCARKINMN